ncbi:MAG: ribosome recycling factor [bacterium]|nr:ribosome recycling factor [bacterium]
MEEIVKNLEAQAERAVEKVRQDFTGVRTNRPTAKLVEDVMVEYYGQMLPIKQLGSIAIMPPREIRVTFWDKNAVASAEKAIRESNIGLNPSIDGTTIRLALPSLTDERRAELLKLIKQLSEEGRIRIRSHRDEANKRIALSESEKKISEDQKFALKDKVQKAVDLANAEIEKLLLEKSKEISE